MNQDNEERWKPIEGFEDLYMVSDRGRVKSLKSGRLLKLLVNGYGYKYVTLCKNGRRKKYKIHRIVANAFIPNINNLPQVNHIDEDPTNNDVSNLEWVTPSQNIRHSIYKQSVKINQLTLDGKFIRQWESSCEIERELGFAHQNIIQCCKGTRKTAYNYRWEYTDGLHHQKMNRPVIALTKDGEFIAEYKSAAEASRRLGIIHQCIRDVLKGKYNTIHGLKFKYADEQ